MDVLTRYHRMRGENAAWLPGQDHAAIATEAVLVRELAKEGLTRDGLGRDEISRARLEVARAVRQPHQRAVQTAGLRAGLATRTIHARSPSSRPRSRKVFVELYREGLIYRGTRLVNWDPQARSRRSPTPRSRTNRTAARCGTCAIAPRTAATAS